MCLHEYIYIYFKERPFPKGSLTTSMPLKYVFKIKDNLTPALIVVFSSNVAINSEHIYIMRKK